MKTLRLGAILLVFSLPFLAYSEEPSLPPTPSHSFPNPSAPTKSETSVPTSSHFKAFTGKITKNKVRIRTMPNLEAPIIREANREDIVLIIGESGDFYAVQPPKGTKAYIFRTFVLDNVVEGSRVNIRLEPDLEAPVIAQLNTGDRIQGIISTQNNKWLEITPPASTRFYVAKEFVSNIGDSEMLSRLEKRGEEVNQYLQTAIERSQAELQKPYEDMHIDGIVETLTQIIQKFPDFPQQISQAKEILKTIQDTYLQKKIAHLETKTKAASETLNASNQQLKDEIKSQQDRLNQLEEQIKKQSSPTISPKEPSSIEKETHPKAITAKMSIWNDTEEKLFQNWLEQHPEHHHTMTDFYSSEREEAVVLKGMVESYEKPVRNKPGDFILINRYTNLPMAYLYSTHINLQDYVGREVTVVGIPRANHNFAYPAYFVLTAE